MESVSVSYQWLATTTYYGVATDQIPYKWIYWRVEYFVICLKNSVGVILIWQNGR